MQKAWPLRFMRRSLDLESARAFTRAFARRSISILNWTGTLSNSQKKPRGCGTGLAIAKSSLGRRGKVIQKASKLLFICSRNRIRSLTAEKLVEGEPAYEARSAGTQPSARIVVTEGHIGW